MLQINDLTYRLGERLLLDHATVSIPTGARVGMGDDRLAIRAGRIEIGIEHALPIGELELAGGRIANVEARRAKQADEPARIGADDARRLRLAGWREARRRRRQPGRRHKARPAGCEEREQGSEREKMSPRHGAPMSHETCARQ
ncbi:MAG: hypothetical protein J0G94_05905 [Sphingomonadales bacterium]|nr:hypothetical protein [Sphingomonadales bacterium]